MRNGSKAFRLWLSVIAMIIGGATVGGGSAQAQNLFEMMIQEGVRQQQREAERTEQIRQQRELEAQEQAAKAAERARAR